MKLAARLVLAAALYGTLSADVASAVPACPGPAPTSRVLLADQGTLESVIVDSKSRIFFTNESSVLRLDGRSSKPRVLLAVESPGGLAFDSDGSLIVGYGNSAGNGTVGDQTGPSGLLRVNPETGASTVYATGLSMANGLVRGPDSSYYASNDFGANIDRVRDGKTERGWAQVRSGNGLAIDRAGRYLYVAQTFQPAAVQRIDLAHPESVTPYAVANAGSVSAGLDGMTRDEADRLFVAANGAGEVWRVDPPPAGFCFLVRGLPPFPDGPSATATGYGDGPFPARNVYVVTFGGQLIELANVAATTTVAPPVAPRPKIRLSVRPRTAIVGRRTRFHFRAYTVRNGRQAVVTGARIRLGRKSARTNARGRAALTATLRRTARYRAVARADFFRSGSVVIRARRARS